MNANSTNKQSWKTVPKRDHVMRERGYLPTQLLAERMGVHVSTIYRLVAKGELLSEQFLGKTYVSLASAIAYAGGEERARALGLLE